jgi:subtilisin family serine protease
MMMRSAAILLACPLLLVPAVASAAPDDPYYSVQWGLHAIEAERAWTESKGRGAVVAVVDTGVDRNHPDLAGRLLTGRDFVDDDNDPQDRNGHGTMVAGIVAASTDNDRGVASVAPHASILPVRVLDQDGTGTSEDVADGIRWAVDHGADVVNLSLAQEGEESGVGLLPDELLRHPAVGDAIEDAARAGATVVIAAGNDTGGGKGETAYDATVPGSMVVGASTVEDRRAAYSNYGKGLDLLAPGGGSATDASDGACTEETSIVSTWWNPQTQKSQYGGGCGTSMAVAFASGVAAMLHARGFPNDQVVKRILQNADDVGAQGRDDPTGYGRLNAARAVGAKALQTALSPAPSESSSSARAQPSLHAQASPIPVPAPGTTKGQKKKSDKPRTEAAPPVALVPQAEGNDARGGIVSIAAFLAAAVALAHAYRLFRAPGTLGARSASR